MSFIFNYSMIIIVSYCLIVLLLGIIGYKKREKGSLSDFYLAGRDMGLVVLFFTLFATQYSGNSLIGFSAKTYRSGFLFICSVTFMVAIVGAYLMYAPKLYKISRREGLITIGDYLNFRFKSPLLSNIAVLIVVFVLSSYILTNLKAIGYVIEMVSGGAISFVWAIIGASIIMLVYETLGGMRSVAWTDVLQGVILMIGCIVLFLVIIMQYGNLEAASEVLKNSQPHILEVPRLPQLFRWMSILIFFPFSIAIYPHAIQRIFAARSKKTLKRSFQVMLCMPLVTTLLIFIIGILGIAYFPGLNKLESETIIMKILIDIVHNMPSMQWLITLFVCAVISAIMSTVDSALLSISSAFIKDLTGQFEHNIPQKRLIFFGKIFAWIIMGVLVYLAIYLPNTIWHLIKIKLEVLFQLTPAIFLGINLPKISTQSILTGLIMGLLTVMLLQIFSIHFEMIQNGMIAIVVNLFFVFSVYLIGLHRKRGGLSYEAN
ncbi:MAG: sodium:solute symporter family protein [bacterium]|nr:sodium:solute symporter family protein [bacterium]